MKHMLGDYYSTAPANFMLWAFVVVFLVLCLVILVSLRRAKIRADREARMAKFRKPAQPRSTFVAVEHMRFDNTQERNVPIEPRHRS